MKLIIEKDKQGCIFAYRESESHFKLVEKSRRLRATKVRKEILDDECNLDYMEMGTYMVINIKK